MTVFAGVLDTKAPSDRPCVTGSTSAEPGEVARAKPRSEARVSAGAGLPRRASTAVWRRAGAGKLDKAGVPGGVDVVRTPRRETSGARARKVDVIGPETDGASGLAVVCALVARMVPDVARMLPDVGRMVADASLSVTGAAAPATVDGIFAGVTRAIALEMTDDAGAVRPVVAAGEDVAGVATRALPAGPATPCRPVGGLGR